ncbi:MAG: hypothetical protein DLM68_18810 [Hyphomicrobiales bacterium]|nr:MAG: hypothetical protein DLM68_18810 [Hyphomicrobiales bacterium]
MQHFGNLVPLYSIAGTKPGSGGRAARAEMPPGRLGTELAYKVSVDRLAAVHSGSNEGPGPPATPLTDHHTRGVRRRFFFAVELAHECKGPGRPGRTVATTLANPGRGLKAGLVGRRAYRCMICLTIVHTRRTRTLASGPFESSIKKGLC